MKIEKKNMQTLKSYSLYSSENVYYIIHILELIVVVLCERKEKKSREMDDPPVFFLNRIWYSTFKKVWLNMFPVESYYKYSWKRHDNI